MSDDFAEDATALNDEARALEEQLDTEKAEHAITEGLLADALADLAAFRVELRKRTTPFEDVQRTMALTNAVDGGGSFTCWGQPCLIGRPSENGDCFGCERYKARGEPQKGGGS